MERYKEGLDNYCQKKDPNSPVEPTWIKRMVDWQDKIIVFRTYDEDVYAIDIIFQRDPKNPTCTDYASIGDQSQQDKPNEIHPYWFNIQRLGFYFDPADKTDQQVIEKVDYLSFLSGGKYSHP